MNSRQQAVGSRQCRTSGHSLPAAYCLLPTHCSRTAFTLAELLIVIGLIVLLLVLAVPALDFITGSRSVEGAQNQISAMLGRARTEAIGLQEPVGVAFFRDPANDRMTMAMVQPIPASPAFVDLVADRDQQVLPTGIGMQMVYSAADPYVEAGVVLFDGYGRLLHQICYVGPNLQQQVTGTASPYPPFPPPQPYSQFGFVLYDREAYQNNQTDAWLDENALPLLVNRYNGTLVKGE